MTKLIFHSFSKCESNIKEKLLLKNKYIDLKQIRIYGLLIMRNLNKQYAYVMIQCVIASNINFEVHLADISVY